MNRPGGKVDIVDFGRMCTMGIVRATEAAALAAASFTGRGDEMGGDEAALGAMAAQLQKLPVGGKVIVGEQGYSDNKQLQAGAHIGEGSKHDADIALMPLEGSSINARSLSNALSVIVIAQKDTLLRVPPIYMEKIAIGPGFAQGLVGLDRSPKDNIEALAKAKGVDARDITVCILDRSRHGKLIEEVRAAGAAIRLIGDGDIAGVIQTTDTNETGIDMYLGIGGADQGILAAAALRCAGGQIEGRLLVRDKEDQKLIKKYEIPDISKIYTLNDMISGDASFAATGVTDGYLLDGVRKAGSKASTQSIVMRASTGSVRIIDTIHDCSLSMS
ncbi:MAG: fructose-bisphosphatase class II family protein [bacterium]|nr:fructose-bisphosphatase class II family protein [bacterium]